jgi:transposase-like protein
MVFRPRLCPRRGCPSSSSGHFRWRRKGFYRRHCDGRAVQRFLCLECRHFFSIQTFRLDYRLKKPHLHFFLFKDFVSKVTHRQSARTLGCSRKTVAHRLELLGKHCRDFHTRRLQEAASGAGLVGTFQLDELETYEHSRRLSPLSVPVLIERKSYFVLDTSVTTLPARGRLSAAEEQRKAARDAARGKRKSGSREAVARSFERLSELCKNSGLVEVQTDCKGSYSNALKLIFGPRCRHGRFSSRAKRDYRNPLFPINHTLAMLRDGISRLVRRTWAASKLKERLERHLWIWIAWRNYVRGITNTAPRVTPAMAWGVSLRRWSKEEMLAWRAFSNTD